MKKVLIIDSHQLFRDFLKNKLSLDQIEVTLSQQNRDGYTKMISTLPNLVIMDMGEDNKNEMDLLEKKASDINTVNIPVIIMGPVAERANIASLAKYGVIKYFAKPIQFDVFFDAIGKVLKIPLSMDLTPSVLDIHHNGNIIFIEFAQGLNQEKLSLLQYKLTDMIEHEGIESPKVIIMFTGLDLSFVDGCNIEFLIENILACPKIHTKNVKILSTNKFIADLIEGHKAYAGIEVSDNLPRILNSLVDTSITSSVSDLITDRIITSSAVSDEEISSINNNFFSDKSSDAIDSTNSGTVLHVAIIDSDTQSLLLTRTVFETVGSKCSQYIRGEDFLADYEPGKFDLVILDIQLSDNRGLEILQTFQHQHDAPPVVIYSQSLQKDLVVKVLSAGARSYIIKPQKPNVLLQKCLSLLRGN
ncbi:MAG: response regulator [Spirochaetia bacterium]|nr:response regulator [Treponema sp.]MCI5665154.1 response regulator [Spirochaetia bacterium]MCI6593275.1 response regulator [Spirochaetia bacterium]MDD7767346.1 response regulator [Treponema sp.]MDY3131122.1 response regulator [Treponema sp.]